MCIRDSTDLAHSYTIGRGLKKRSRRRQPRETSSPIAVPVAPAALEGVRCMLPAAQPPPGSYAPRYGRRSNQSPASSLPELSRQPKEHGWESSCSTSSFPGRGRVLVPNAAATIAQHHRVGDSSSKAAQQDWLQSQNPSQHNPPPGRNKALPCAPSENLLEMQSEQLASAPTLVSTHIVDEPSLHQEVPSSKFENINGQLQFPTGSSEQLLPRFYCRERSYAPSDVFKLVKHEQQQQREGNREAEQRRKEQRAKQDSKEARRRARLRQSGNKSKGVANKQQDYEAAMERAKFETGL
eukprot:TRINITY_DN50701_c0_g1_i2.p1 TRINITY_DN50701_c0_g1~~TRINITY_DN50701_c0_g1_i2.p1  ORF type:complete len:296 (-),score=50.04 TRINITY_DN50701_c0_g1_i2:106-993(-)